MKRVLGFFLAFLLLTGGAAACSDDDKDDTSSETTAAADGGDTEETTDEGGDSGSGNADVAAYCEAVDAYVAKAKEVLADPASADAATLAAEGQELTDTLAELQSQASSLTEDCLLYTSRCV